MLSEKKVIHCQRNLIKVSKLRQRQIGSAVKKTNPFERTVDISLPPPPKIMTILRNKQSSVQKCQENNFLSEKSN